MVSHVLNFIYTDLKYRNKGYGAKLLTHVKERHDNMVAFIDGEASEKLFSKFYQLRYNENILPIS